MDSPRQISSAQLNVHCHRHGHNYEEKKGWIDARQVFMVGFVIFMAALTYYFWKYVF